MITMAVQIIDKPISKLVTTDNSLVQILWTISLSPFVVAQIYRIIKTT